MYVVLIICQGLSLAIFSSDVCNKFGDVEFWLASGGENIDENTGELTDEAKNWVNYVTSETVVTCKNGRGSKMAISAIFMWFLAAITCYWNVKKTRDI